MQAIAGLYRFRGREAEACDYVRRAVALSPASVETQAELGMVYRAFHHWEAAESVYRSLVELPGGRAWMSGWGVVLKALNDPRAEEVFAQASGAAQARGDRLAHGQVYELWGKREEAVAAYRRCLWQSPRRPTSVTGRSRRSGVSEPRANRPPGFFL
jgi:tetratricopeptide (TPR) repeat protein